MGNAKEISISPSSLTFVLFFERSKLSNMIGYFPIIQAKMQEIFSSGLLFCSVRGGGGGSPDLGVSASSRVEFFGGLFSRGKRPKESHRKAGASS